jgi:4-aminobutyrate aminotransferase-like enzyme
VIRQETIAREQAALMRNYGRYPVEFVRGQGAWLFDPDGRGYLDLMSGISMINAGHCHPDVVAAIRDQAGVLGTGLPVWCQGAAAPPSVARMASRVALSWATSASYFSISLDSTSMIAGME